MQTILLREEKLQLKVILPHAVTKQPMAKKKYVTEIVADNVEFWNGEIVTKENLKDKVDRHRVHRALKVHKPSLMVSIRMVPSYRRR